MLDSQRQCSYCGISSSAPPFDGGWRLSQINIIPGGQDVFCGRGRTPLLVSAQEVDNVPIISVDSTTRNLSQLFLIPITIMRRAVLPRIITSVFGA